MERRNTPFPCRSRLGALAELAQEAGAAHLAEETLSLGQRVAENRFDVTCVGQFKRGKSSLINALVGEAILPVGVAPVTSVVTVLRHGQHRSARVSCSSCPRGEGYRRRS